MRSPRLVAFLTCAALLSAGASSSAVADIRILGSPGGEVGSFLRVFELVRESGERVIIDGRCYSACTLVLSMVPQERICVTRRAVLGFHGATLVDRGGNVFVRRRRSLPPSPRPILSRYRTGSPATAA